MKFKRLKDKFTSGFLSGILMLTTILTTISPMTVKASDGTYTIESLGDKINYSDAFSGVDDVISGWVTNTFTVSTPDNVEYTALCATPNQATPGAGTEYSATEEYGSDSLAAKVLFYSIGSGVDSGPLAGYSEDIRIILAHHTVAFATNDGDWNTREDVTALGWDGRVAYDMALNLIDFAENNGTGDYDVVVTYLTCDNSNLQNLALYSETYNPKELTGSVRFHKESAMPSISDGNSCYSLAGAEISIYSDADCTDLLDTLTTGEDGYTDYYSRTFREGDSITLYFKETKAPKGFLINDEVRSITLDSEDSYTETITDMPGNDPIRVLLKKQTADGHGSGDTRLEGAEYTVKYYDILSDTDPAQGGNAPKYTWVFRTDKDGRIRFTADYLVDGSDGLISDINGAYSMPLGTITLQETKAPEGYLINDTVYVAQTILENNYIRTTNLPTDDKAAQETPYEGTISIEKFLGGKNEVKTTEAGAEFQIYLKSSGSYEAAAEENRQIITTDENGYAITKRLPYGTYTIHQVKGNNKYYFVKDIDVTISENGRNYHNVLEDVPIEYYLKMVKKDVDTGKIIALAGTTFEIYDETGAKVELEVMTDSGKKKISSFTTNDDGVVYTTEKIIAGRYTLVETKAPDGYILDSTPVEFTISDDDVSYEDNVIIVEKSDKAVRGSISVTKQGEVLDKWDTSQADNKNHFVYKKVNLAKAVFKLVAKENILSPDDKSIIYNAGDIVTTLTTGADGKAYADNLYLGRYELIEINAPEGYVIDETPVEVTLSYSGQTIDIVKADKTIEDERQKVVVSANKKDTVSFNPLQNTVFALIANEDIVNHDGNVVVKKGTIIEKQITNALGKAIFVSDLPLGNYIVKEIDSPTGYGNKFEYKTINAVYKGQIIDVQRFSFDFEDDHTEIVRTQATDTATGTHQGVLSADNKYVIYDHVECDNLFPGKTYTLKGILIDKNTGKTLGDINGNDVTESVTFKATGVKQTVTVKFSFGAELAGKTIVVFENMFQDGKMIYTHADIDDTEQTIYYPEIHTTATDKASQTHTGTVGGQTTITDKVDYKNLIIGNTYEVSGVLMNRETGEKLLDKNGNTITSEKKFTAESKNGSIDIEFTFDSILLEGKSVVVFEDVYNNGIKVAAHADIKDENQTVYYPEIHTTATDAATKTHTAAPDSKSTIIDKVDYKNLVPGESYEVSGIIMDKTTGEAFIDKNGNTITSKTAFKAEKAGGSIDVTFTFDSTLLEDKSVVVYEYLYNGNEEVTSHADITDEGQTINFPKIHTTATDKVTKSHTGVVDEKATITDKVDYSNLTVGEKYKVSGILMNRETGEKLLDKNGNEITSEKEFTAESKNGSIDIEFTFDSTLLEDKSVVVYEYLYNGNEEVTSHADITDEGQTINFPKIHTTATDKVTKSHTGVVDEKATITDKVDYSNLTVGEKYKVSGILMNRETGEKLLDKNGNEITSEKEFTAESKNGSIDIEFTFDSTLLEGKTVVVFEDVYNNGIKVAAHADIKDENQTVYYPEIHTTATDAATKTHTAAPDSKSIITDKVDYKNLVAGYTYEITGVLMDKSTGKALLDNDKKEITATKKFTAQKPDGTIDIEFTFDSTMLEGKSVVVFENLYNENIKVAFHTDIKDEGQTVNFAKLHTTATDKATKLHTGVVDEKTTITDKVAYSNLTVGEKYKVSGILMNKETGEKLLDKDGKEITSVKEFTAESKNGNIDIEFTFDSTLLEGKTVVVFEDVYNNGIKVAAHADIKDEEQSIHYPEIHTTATIDSAKSITEKGSVILKDVVDYKNLIIGNTYEVKGVLMNQETGEKFLDKNGNEITGSASFTAQKADGSVDVTFTFDSSLLAGNTIVVFENLYENNVKVIGHADINDVNQTVEIVKTGDTSNAYIYALIAIISLAVMVSLVMIKKSRNHN